jgi:D-amino-acid oxidase
VADDEGPNALAYVLPRRDVCVVGGTVEPVANGSPPSAPDPAVRAGILERCARIAPGITGAEVLGDRIGDRPVRAGGVRLEREARPDGGVTIHDYGHGGAGWTLAWGCALDVRDLVASL